jgi:lipopolysaccharide export system protein LptC
MRALARLLGVLIAIAAVSATWWLEALRHRDGPDREAPQQSHEPAVYFTDFTLVDYTDARNARHRVRGQRLVRYADDATTDVVRPRTHHRPSEGPPWRTRARRGRLGADGQEIALSGHVVLERGGREGLTIETPRLTVERRAGRARTSAPVRARGHGWLATAVGMEALFELGRIRLRAEVESRYSPAETASDG